MKKNILNVISKAALNTAKKEVNSACICIGYQPKAPHNAEKLKKKF